MIDMGKEELQGVMMEEQKTDQESADATQEKSGVSVEDTHKAYEAQLKATEQKLLYLYADFDNYKRRMVKERADLLKFGWESGARDFVGILENLSLALSYLPDGSEDKLMNNLQIGLKMVYEQFVSTLERQGVKAVVALGKSFDPNLHEAVSKEVSEQPAGTVIQELAKGYMLHDRLLRPARVVVSVQADSEE